MTAITRDLLKAISKDMNKAIAEVCAKHGIKGELGNARFDDKEATFKLLIVGGEVAEAGEDDEHLAYRNAMRRYGPLYGTGLQDCGRVIKIHDRELMLIGMGKTGKFFIGQGPQGGLWKLDIADVRAELKK